MAWGGRSEGGQARGRRQTGPQAEGKPGTAVARQAGQGGQAGACLWRLPGGRIAGVGEGVEEANPKGVRPSQPPQAVQSNNGLSAVPGRGAACPRLLGTADRPLFVRPQRSCQTFASGTRLIAVSPSLR